MFTRAVAEGTIDPSKFTQISLRTWNDTDAVFQILDASWVHENGIDAALSRTVERACNAPVYISWDVDGFDPAFTPGTGTPICVGLATWQGLKYLRGLGDLNLIGMDVVGLSPPYDHANITALAAATVAHDWLCLLAQK